MSYFAIGAGSGGSIGGRDVSNRLSFAGDIVNGRMETVANSDLAIDMQQPIRANSPGCRVQAIIPQYPRPEGRGAAGASDRLRRRTTMSERFAGQQPGAPGQEDGPRGLGAHGVAAPDLDRSGPMLQAHAKQKELEMNPAERQLFERAMTLVQNKTGMTEDDARKVATDVVLTARHTPGLSEKPEYMDVKNGHVMIAEKVGKEPIFNGYVNVEQSRGQSADQLQEKVAAQNNVSQERQLQERQVQDASKDPKPLVQATEDRLTNSMTFSRTI